MECYQEGWGQGSSVRVLPRSVTQYGWPVIFLELVLLLAPNEILHTDEKWFGLYVENKVPETCAFS